MVLFGIIAYPVRAALSAVGAYILYSMLVLLCLWWIVAATPLRKYFLASARSSREEKKEGSGKKAVAFSDLPDPARTAPVPEQAAGYPQQPAPQYAQPQYEQPYAQPYGYAPAAPAYPAPEAPAPAQPSDPRDILFRNDPAGNYRDNLIFNRDSRFNTQPRRSTVGPVPSAASAGRDRPSAPAQPAAQSAPVQPAAQSAPVQPEVRYTERYASDAAAGRPSMPRGVTQVRPAPEAEEDLNYPQSPAYRAPSEPAKVSDFYAHDVPVSPFTSQPSVYDEPYEMPEEPEEPVRPTYTRPAPVEEPEEPVRPTYTRPAPAEPEEPVRPTYTRPAPAEPEEPVRPTYTRPAPVEEPEEPVRPTYTRPVEEMPEEPISREPFAGSSRFEGRSAEGLFDDEPEETEELPEESVRGAARVQPEPAEPSAPPAPVRHIYKPYVHPDINALRTWDNVAKISPEEIEQNSAIIVDTLAGFRVDAEIIGVKSGATVTRYDVDIPRNIAVSQVIKRDAEIAMRLHTRDGVNIYSNSEAGAISIEVPNSVRATVGLKTVMEADEYVHSKAGTLMFAVGQDVSGRNVVGDIVKMTHILVAGSTNSGKSICLDAMIVSLICKYSPEELRLILIDPKKTEFIVFDGLPHLMINEIISDAQKAVSAFNWAIKEMERRYTLFEKKTRGGTNVRDIDGYNKAIGEDEEKLPKIVIIVDELADLMSVAKKDIEERIQRLTQKARAAGIHMVLATQRPSVDVITGVIKGNLPTRMALRVISDVDSRTILDESGAQKLLGKGDMLLRTGGMFNSLRVQGAFVGEDEMQTIVEDVKAHNEAYFDSSVADYINKAEGETEGGVAEDAEGSVDPQYIKALGIVVNLGQASISLIQRKCSVGYNHAGKIIEWMELMGYISPFDGKAKARSVLLSKEDFEAKYGDLN